MLAAVDAFEEYHAFGAEFVTVAIRPGSAASPFSAESSESRDLSQGVFRELCGGGVTRGAEPPARGELPELLWLAQLGVTLFWVYDSSPGRRRTRTLVEGVTPLIGRLVQLSPAARPARCVGGRARRSCGR